LFGDVLKLPVAQISIKDIAVVEAAEIQIHQTITVHIARSNARAIQVNLIGHIAFDSQAIRKKDSRASGRQLNESRLAARGNLQLSVPKAVPGLPCSRAEADVEANQADGKRAFGDFRVKFHSGRGEDSGYWAELMMPGRANPACFPARFI